MTCFDNLPQRCLVDREDVLQSVETQRVMLKGICGFNNGGEGETTTPPEVGKKINMTR